MCLFELIFNIVFNFIGYNMEYSTNNIKKKLFQLNIYISIGEIFYIGTFKYENKT